MPTFCTTFTYKLWKSDPNFGSYLTNLTMTCEVNDLKFLKSIWFLSLSVSIQLVYLKCAHKKTVKISKKAITTTYFVQSIWKLKKSNQISPFLLNLRSTFPKVNKAQNLSSFQTPCGHTHNKCVWHIDY